MLSIGYQPWGETLDEVVSAARAAEAAGAGVVWLPELHRSSTVAAAAVAHGTSTVSVATGIALAFARSPMTIALEALDLAELSGGRFRLGLGTGTRRMNEEWHGVPFEHPVDRMGETVEAVRAFWRDASSGQGVHTGGMLRPMRVRGYQRPFAPPAATIPVHLAGVGPHMVALAGRVADGWLSHELCSPAYLRDRVLPRLEKGLADSGRTRGDLVVTASAMCAVALQREEAAALAAGHVGFYAGVRTYADFFGFHGVLEEHERIAAELKAGTPAHELRASAEMQDTLALVGSRDDVLTRIGEYAGTVDEVKLSPPVHGLEPAQIRAAQAELIDLIAELTR
jgi:probable F420-dependent oxidoreductase